MQTSEIVLYLIQKLCIKRMLSSIVVSTKDQLLRSVIIWRSSGQNLVDEMSSFNDN